MHVFNGRTVMMAMFVLMTLQGAPALAEEVCVDLYENTNWGGQSARLCGDSTVEPTSDYIGLPYNPHGVNWHYRISSFKCLSDRIASVRLIDGNAAGGTAATPRKFKEFTCDEGRSGVAASFDKATTGISIEYKGYSCVDLYEGPNLTGAMHRVCYDGSKGAYSGYIGLPYTPGGPVNWHYRVSSFECRSDGAQTIRLMDGNAYHPDQDPPYTHKDFSCDEGNTVATSFNDGATGVGFIVGVTLTDGMVVQVKNKASGQCLSSPKSTFSPLSMAECASATPWTLTAKDGNLDLFDGLGCPVASAPPNGESSLVLFTSCGKTNVESLGDGTYRIISQLAEASYCANDTPHPTECTPSPSATPANGRWEIVEVP